MEILRQAQDDSLWEDGHARRTHAEGMVALQPVVERSDTTGHRAPMALISERWQTGALQRTSDGGWKSFEILLVEAYAGTLEHDSQLFQVASRAVMFLLVLNVTLRFQDA